MPDDLDLSRPVEAPDGSAAPAHLGAFRADLATGRCTWFGARPGLEDDVDPLAALSGVAFAPHLTGTVALVHRRDGQRPVLLLARPEHDAAGEFVAIVGDVVDLGSTAPAALTERIGQLENALRTRPVIEQAKGMLMQTHRCTEEVAFRLLIGMSQALNRKLRDIAADIVTAMSRDEPLPEATARALAAELAQLRHRGAGDAPTMIGRDPNRVAR